MIGIDRLDQGPRVRGSESGKMGRDELRALQAPLKEHYREEPAAAVVTLRAEGTLGDGISCSVATGRAIAEAGLHPASGGDGLLLCSGDMLLQAFVACAGVTLRAVATSWTSRSTVGRCTPRATSTSEGRLRSRRTRRSASPPSVCGLPSTPCASEEQLDTLLRLTERYCVVYQTLAKPPSLSITRTSAG